MINFIINKIETVNRYMYMYDIMLNITTQKPYNAVDLK